MENRLPLKFDIYQNGRLVRSEKVVQDVIKIGKLSSSHLRIDDEGVSRMHAIIEVTGPGEVSLIDLGSTRGTEVNGKRVEKRQRLASGDRILLGVTTVVVFIGEEDIARAEADQARRQAEEAARAAEALAERERAARARAAGNTAPAPESSPAGGGAAARTGPMPSPGAGRPAAPPPSSPTPRPMTAGEKFLEARKQAERAALLAAAKDLSFEEDPTAMAVEVVFLFGDSVVDVHYLTRPQDLLVGQGRKVAYSMPTDAFGMEEFPLIRAVGTSFALVFTPAMKGKVQTDGATLTLDELVEKGRAVPASGVPGASQFLLSQNTRARVDVGKVSFLVHAVSRPSIGKAVAARKVQWNEISWGSISVLLHLLVLLLLFVVPPEFDEFGQDQFSMGNRFVQFMVRPERRELEKKKKDYFKDLGEKTAAAKEKAGKMGKKDAEDVNKRFAVKGPKDNKTLQLAREVIVQKVTRMGALSVLNASEQWSSLIGQSDASVGSDAVNAMGNFLGSGAIGTARGMGGLGIEGIGRGGGGVAEDSIGVGMIGTRGIAGGDRNYGRGAGRLGDRTTGAPKIIAARPDITGSLDKEIIRKVINQHRNEIKYCYEKELQRKKDLEGKVVVKFTISPTGAVIKSQVVETTMNHPPTEECINQHIRRWLFPSPKGGGIVEVKYPFIFKAS